MTVLIGLKCVIENSTKVLVASDTRVTCGGEILPPVNKMVKFPNFVVLGCGLATVGYTLRRMSKDKAFLRESFCKLKDIDDATDVFRSISMNLRTTIEISPDSNASNDTSVIIATPTNLYSVDPYFYAYESDIVCSGSGGKWSHPWLEGVYSNIRTVYDMEREVIKALDLASSRDAGCASPYNLLFVSTNTLPGQPKVKKIVKKKKDADNQ